MRNRTIQMVTLLAIISMSGIVVLQVFWFRKAFDVRERQFDQNVSTSLQRVGEQLLQINRQQIPNARLVKQLSSNYFVVSVNGEIDTKVLESLLTTDFIQHGLILDFEYGVYDCNHQKLVYGNYVSFSQQEPNPPPRELPKWKNDLYYFTVNFPDKTNNLIGSMNIWLFSSLVLLMVVLFFSFALVTILRQKQLSDVQKDFVNNMTHEFKTPVSTILVTSRLLTKPEVQQQVGAIEHYSNMIQTEALRLKSQVERVLQVALSDQKKMEYQMEEIDFHECLEHAIASAKELVKEKGGTINTDLNAANPRIRGDRMHLINMIFNLLDNSIKYNNGSPVIDVTTGNVGRKLQFTVRDNGTGISKKNSKRIFDQFYRVSTGDVHDVKGFGLGLYYVRHVVKDHGGKVKLQSELGRGTTITIIFRQ
ncbi:MAG: HAMP domain-containing histidine kinase [Chitinophagales bacterium]|nr:HAMP domain-containing histidine kinase [Chitinophagales bacterium]